MRCQDKRIKISVLWVFLLLLFNIKALGVAALPLEGIDKEDLSDFSKSAYYQSVKALCENFEKMSKKDIKPGKLGKVGLKVYCNSGRIMCTSQNLVLALIDFLKERGFKEENIWVIDHSTTFLTMCEYLGENSFLGPKVKVLALDSDNYYDKSWFYENPLPPDTGMQRFWANPIVSRLRSSELTDEDRRSYLAKPLVDEVDFWINLPVVTDQVGLGVNGVLANASVWTVSNNMRFLNSPANGPAAVAEIAAIPETFDRWMFTLLSLENYQYIGGPKFNALYTVNEKELWLGTNAVGMDYLMWLKINRYRARGGFPLIEPMPTILKYGEVLDLGSISNKKN